MAPNPTEQGPQVMVGDDLATELDEKRARLQEKTLDIFASIGNGGPSKPKHALRFFENISFKTVGGQQLTATCMYCGSGPIASTGSTRLVHHLTNCLACPKEVRKPFQDMQAVTGTKRKAKTEAEVLAAEEADRLLQAEKVYRELSLRTYIRRALMLHVHIFNSFPSSGTQGEAEAAWHQGRLSKCGGSCC